MAAAEGSSARSSSAADSYLGSLISLTSKSEIRYEGVLYNVNTEESSIGLRNVRSFGTEGRKKDGPQIPPGDKVYDYILFRGSDIKDLQVKSSPPTQPAPAPAPAPAPSINNDPAIIQSHYPSPIPPPTAMHSAAAAPTTDVGSHTSQMGLAPNFQGGLPLYQPGSNMGPWGASPLPPTANPGGLALPMYWQGYYGSPSPMPQMHPQTLLRPPPGLSVPPPPLSQPNQHISNSLFGGASNLHDTSTSLLSMSSSLLPMTSTSLPSMLSPVSLPTLASETLSSSLPTNKDPMSGLPLASSANAPTIGATKDSITMLPPGPVPQSAHLLGTSISVSTENPAPTPIPSLVTPGQLLPPGPINLSLSESSQVAQKDVEVVLLSSPPSPPPAEPLEPAGEAQPPILPLPPPTRTGFKHNESHFQNRYGYRGRERGRGRGSWSSRPVSTYSEDFDFMAMNEKFNKDEVWGHLGKSVRTHSADVNVPDEEDFHDENEAEASKSEVKPVYNKDDFFDSLSCDALNRNSHGGRGRFSEQRRVDTETFGEFSRYRGNRGGRGPSGYHGNFRGRGSYNGRGYGYNQRGRGRAIYTSAS